VENLGVYCIGEAAGLRNRLIAGSEKRGASAAAARRRGETAQRQRKAAAPAAERNKENKAAKRAALFAAIPSWRACGLKAWRRRNQLSAKAGISNETIHG
jgi:hypothetical protein